MQWIALLPPAPLETGAPPGALMQAGLQQALGWLALRFTPRVSLLDEAVLLEVSASIRLFGGLPNLQALLAQSAAVLLAVPSCGPPLQAQGSTSLVALGRLRAAQSDAAWLKAPPARLPLHALSAAREHLGVLERIGCRTWGDLKRLPRDGVARRFGAPLLDALDRARGHKPETPLWLSLPEVFDEKLELPAHLETTEALMPGIDHLLARLHAWLLARQSGLLALRLTWHLDPRRDLPPRGEQVVRTARAMQDLSHLRRLLVEHLARVSLPAPVHSVSLCSLEVEVLQDAQAASASLLIEECRLGASVGELVERLSARLGAPQVRSCQPQADHRPEHMQSWVAAQPALARPARMGRARRQGAAAGVTHPAFIGEALYPTWLLAVPIRLVVRAHRPVYQGPLKLLAGPQRLETSGWSAGQGAGQDARAPAMRDYFIARSEQAGLLWIYRERPTGDSIDWYLHGVFA